MKKLRLYTSLYTKIFIPTILVTIIVARLSIATEFKAVIPTIWFKLFTTAVILYFTHYRIRHEIYYYYNLNLSKKGLLLTATVIDLFVFSAIMYTTYLFYNLPL